MAGSHSFGNNFEQPSMAAGAQDCIGRQREHTDIALAIVRLLAPAIAWRLCTATRSQMTS
eukprot:3880851-Pyramimonas_sp.AAC.2